MSTRAKNDSLYNPDFGIKPEKGILRITPDLMPEVRKTMNEKGIPSELVKESKLDLLQVLTEEDETVKVFQELKHRQVKSHNNLHKHFQKHKKILAELTENYDEIGQEIKLFHKYLSMIETQCFH